MNIQISSDGTGPIKREWIAGRALTIGETPIVIPKLGYLSLWMEKYQSNPYTITRYCSNSCCFNWIWRIKIWTKTTKEK